MGPHPHHRHPAHQMWLLAQRQWPVPGPAQPDLRIGDAERTAVTEALQQHFAEGRLDADELEERVGRALAAKTEADLAVLVRDLPGPPPWRPVPGPCSRHPRHRRRFLRAPLLLFLFVLVPVALIAGAPGLILAGLRVLLLVLLLSFLFHYLRRHRRAH